MPFVDPDTLAQRYVTMWTEPDPGRRRQIVEELWAPDGVHRLRPPEESRAAAAQLGVTAVFEAAGHDAIEHRVTTAYEDFVVKQSYTFRFPGDAQRVGSTVMFRWESVLDGEVAGTGTEFVVLGADGRIISDHMFPG